MSKKSKKKRQPGIGAAIFVLIVFIFISILALQQIRIIQKNDIGQEANSSSLLKTAIPNYKHIFVILEENDSFKHIYGNPKASFLNSFMSQNSLAANYHAVAHPSLPNYLALIGGTTGGISTDCLPDYINHTCVLNHNNLTDEIEKSGRTWKAYYESMPAACSTVPIDNVYSVNMNPFVYFNDIYNTPGRCNQHDVPFSQLSSDIAGAKNGDLPNFVFIVPNMCNDMHSCPINVGDAWIAGESTKLLDSQPFTKQNSLLAITWDEDDHSQDNLVPLILAGSQVRKNYVSYNHYNHYSLLHTIEKAWNLQPLTSNDKNAPTLNEFFILTQQ